MLRKSVLACLIMAIAAAAFAASPWNPKPPIDTFDQSAVEALRAKLKNYPYKIVYQTCRGANFELFIMNADGSDPKNLTNTPDRNEYYPQCSFDGKMIAYEADGPTLDKDGKQVMKDGKPAVHDQIWLMNADGTNQRMILDNAQQPAWSHDCKTIAYMREENGKMCQMMFYDVATGVSKPHPNKSITWAMNLSFTRDDKWITAVVYGTFVGTDAEGRQQTLNVSQSILAFETNGQGIVDLIHQSRDLPNDPTSGQAVMGCRPDVSHDGKRITWAIEEKYTRMWIAVADLSEANGWPKASNWSWVATAPMNQKPKWELYHPDWSPDDQFIVFAKGQMGSLMKTARFMPRAMAPTWNIAVCDPNNPGPYIEITTDGQSNKEPDFLPIAK
ncbi:hypothetical protein LLG95_12450 [bacterium]|nr:hypothetical protein [bacterium]